MPNETEQAVDGAAISQWHRSGATDRRGRIVHSDLVGPYCIRLHSTRPGWRVVRLCWQIWHQLSNYCMHSAPAMPWGVREPRVCGATVWWCAPRPMRWWREPRVCGATRWCGRAETDALVARATRVRGNALVRARATARSGGYAL
jgi:hypothetical protein